MEWLYIYPVILLIATSSYCINVTKSDNKVTETNNTDNIYRQNDTNFDTNRKSDGLGDRMNIFEIKRLSDKVNEIKKLDNTISEVTDRPHGVDESINLTTRSPVTEIIDTDYIWKNYGDIMKSASSSDTDIGKTSTTNSPVTEVIDTDYLWKNNGDIIIKSASSSGTNEDEASIKQSPNTVLNTTASKGSRNNRIQLPQPDNNKFVFKNIDWYFNEFEDNGTESLLGTRINGDDVDPSSVHISAGDVDKDNDEGDKPPITESQKHSDNGTIIIRYPVNEMDPPLTVGIPPRASIIAANISEIEKERACEYGGENFTFPEVPQINKTGRRVIDYKCEEQMWFVKYRIHDVRVNKEICLAGEVISSVVGGIDSYLGEFPHMGAVGWLTNDNDYTFHCGTSLISTRFSVTAGHCTFLPDRGFHNVNDTKPKIVRFGHIDVTIDIGTINMIIETILTPEDYHYPVRYNDIALIRFTKDISFMEYVIPACIWHKSFDLIGPAANVTGWGQTESGMSNPKNLKRAKVDFINHEKCKSLISPVKYNRHFKDGLADSQFCAGDLDGRVDTCQGDSGGPIQIWEPFPHDKNFPVHYVVGITSFGFNCAKSTPAIYTNVTFYLCWIEKTVWPNEENTHCP